MTTLIFTASVLKFIGALLYADVRFVIVGGYAVRFHGHMRLAEDLDIFLEPSAENASRFVKALSGFNKISITSGQLAIVRMTLAKLSQKFSLKKFGYPIDVLTSLNTETPISFETAFQEAEWCLEKCFKIPVLSLDHLIQCKHACGEAKDLEDIAALELARRDTQLPIL